jgi:hypothetical protein
MKQRTQPSLIRGAPLEKKSPGSGAAGAVILYLVIYYNVRQAGLH